MFVAIRNFFLKNKTFFELKNLGFVWHLILKIVFVFFVFKNNNRRRKRKWYENAKMEAHKGSVEKSDVETTREDNDDMRVTLQVGY